MASRFAPALGVLMTACTMSNPAFEDGSELADDASAGSELETGLDEDATLEGGTSEADTSTSEADTSTTEADTSTSEPDTSASETDTSTTGDGNCGNAVIDPEEECDDGNSDEGDGCTSICTYPICGDGLLEAGPEACDDGNLDDTDDCTVECQFASCGDGIVHATDEECDDGNVAKLDGCSEICKAEYRIVFATSTMHVGGEIGGLNGADEICKERATAANLPGEYVAWLSTDEGSPSSRFNKGVVPYVLPTPQKPPVAVNWTDLTDGALLIPISVTETGAPILGLVCGDSDRVWTGTQPNGAAHPNTCSNFTSPNAVGALGSAASFVSWSICNPNGSCGAAARLFCVQQ